MSKFSDYCEFILSETKQALPPGAVNIANKEDVPKSATLFIGKRGGLYYYYPNGKTNDTTESIKETGFTYVKNSKYKNEIILTKKKLIDILDNGSFSIISAGRNPQSEDDKKLSDKQIETRTAQLKADLDAHGIKFTECVGYYGGAAEMSLVVPHEQTDFKHENKSVLSLHDGSKEDIAFMDKLGEKYNQDSVFHGVKKRFDLHFMTGKHKGKNCGGTGWKEDSKADMNYTVVKSPKGQTKLQMDISECFEPGQPLA